MKTLMLMLAFAAVPALCLVSAEPKKPALKSMELVVPAGKTYVKLDQNRKEIARFSAGQRMRHATSDCVQVDCPDTFGKDIVCWKCKSSEPPPKKASAASVKKGRAVSVKVQ